MSYKILVEKRAEKELDNLSSVDRKRVSKKILLLEDNPFPQSSLMLKHMLSGYRLRVGNWRVFYNVNEKTRVVSVYAVRHRREAYRR